MFLYTINYRCFIGSVYESLSTSSQVNSSLKDCCSSYDNISPMVNNYSHLEKLLNGIVPHPIGFSEEYRNFCWQVNVNLNQTLDMPELSKLYTNQQDSGSIPNALTWNVADSQMVCFPSVFMGAFPRSGSTYIYNLLKLHPFIKPGRVKEPHFWTKFPFQGNDKSDTLAILTYLANFKEGSDCSISNPNCITIDASQSLLWYTKTVMNDCTVPKLVRKFIPNAKFIILMRNPIDRTYSDFFSFGMEDCAKFFSKRMMVSQIFHIRMRSEINRFLSCLNSHNLHYCTHYTLATSPKVYKDCGELRLASSIYVAHIERWLQYFPRKQFLFLRLDDVVTDLYSVMKRIWSFVGVPLLSREKFEQILIQVPRKPKRYESMKDATRMILSEFFHPFNQKLATILDDERFLWKPR